MCCKVAGSVIVDFTVLVPSADTAVQQVTTMQQAATAGSLTLGGIQSSGVTSAVPLMGQPRTGRKYSVAVGKFIDELSSGGNAPGSEDGAAMDAAAPPPPPPPSPPPPPFDCCP